MENKIKSLKPKIKLRELRAIQKDEKVFKESTERGVHGNNDFGDRELKKIMQLEEIFNKKEKDEVRKLKLKEKREQKE